MVFGVIWMTCSAVVPAVIGKAIDAGVTGRDSGELWKWSAILFGVGVIQSASGIMRHRYAVLNWLTSAYRVVQLVTRQATHLGATLSKRVATGEVVAIGTNDLSHIGNAMDVLARAMGALVSFVVVAVILLQTSVTLGLVVLIGVPVLLLLLGPLLKPLQQRNLEQRDMMGHLSNIATDIVSGLRVLRGIGGERIFHDRYRTESQKVRQAGNAVARLQSVLDALQVFLPGVFVVVVVWLGARFAVQDKISPGELVAFYGYAAFLVLPLRTATEAANKWIRAHVSARRIVKVLALQPEIEDPRLAADAPAPDSELVDVRSGLRIRPGVLTAVVSEPAGDAAEVVDRLGRFAEGDVIWGGVRLDTLPRALVRERIVVSDTSAILFAGRLADQLAGIRAADPDRDERLARALHAAATSDVLEALPEGLDTLVAEKGRSFSGGQRQRLILARALARDPEVLILVESTSAVDAHTEARIAERLVGNRAGRTTVVTTSSPLMLSRADVVVFLEGGRVVAEGRHADLLTSSPAYRAVVTREEAEDVEEVAR
ncbi:ABC transporter ATP-binding protein [Nocardioides marmorisolisilvae]|uniref:ABC transporter ATP-binding protein n=2 Tax=Nocardioides marmorisolisilvae TaxID=1542737 RepID=A0A3N0DXE4_9ACTN|nr:ABC transporter ATP-binding protein [Nocardioides marmorisolisilvae]